RHPPDAHSFPIRRSSDLTTSQAITRAEKPIQSRPTRLGIERTRYARPTNRSESASTTCLSSIATVSGSLRAEGWLLRSEQACDEDRKSTRLNSSHVEISY